MKKLVLGIVFFVSLTLAVSAIEISAGIGGDVGLVFTSIDTTLPEPYKSELDAYLDSLDKKRWGISAFFDAQYIEANLGFKFLVSSYSEWDSVYEETQHFFNAGLKLKYPFKITETIRLFPLVGFDYSIFISGKGEDDFGSYSVDRVDLDPVDRIDRFSINAGIGVDFYVVKDVFIRGEFNYTLLLNTKAQKETIDLYKSNGYDLSIFEHGPVFKLAIGYRFIK